MEENRDYHAYRYGDHLTPGSELKIEHSVVCENVDISTLITMGTDSLEAMRQGSIDGEQNPSRRCALQGSLWAGLAACCHAFLARSPGYPGFWRCFPKSGTVEDAIQLW